jgi:hypothetical protein
MNSYWPLGLDLSDSQSPMEILLEAQSEWSSNGQGVLALILQQALSESGNEMIIVLVEHLPSKRAVSLFSVVSPKGHKYPVRLQPKDEDLPKFFKKSYKTESGFSTLGMLNPVSERTTTNEWVADTPGEFRIKLTQVFNLGNIKSVILNLISSNDSCQDVSNGKVEPVTESESHSTDLTE